MIKEEKSGTKNKWGNNKINEIVSKWTATKKGITTGVKGPKSKPQTKLQKK